MPISLLEAMSYGNCCLTSDISECADVIEDYGITFKKGDVWSLREKLQSLCDSPEIVAEYKSKAADFICDKYSWDVTVDKTLELYKR
jgi:glycosyltransferase involved in cell wall biosynthesis